MIDHRTTARQPWRRGELMAEIFLEELEPKYVARSPDNNELGFDFLVGFENNEGGLNTYAVEVQATEQPISGTMRVSRETYNRLAHSNIPLILLVVDVKQNQLFYACPWRQELDASSGTSHVTIPLTFITEESRDSLRAQLVG